LRLHSGARLPLLGCLWDGGLSSSFAMRRFLFATGQSGRPRTYGGLSHGGPGRSSGV